MKMTKTEAHIGKMGFDQCTQLMTLVDVKLGSHQHKWLELQAKENHDPEAAEEEDRRTGDD